MPETTDSGTVESEPPMPKEQEPQAEVELESLAERILQLLKEDARLERERLGGRRGW